MLERTSEFVCGKKGQEGLGGSRRLEGGKILALQDQGSKGVSGGFNALRKHLKACSYRGEEGEHKRGKKFCGKGRRVGKERTHFLKVGNADADGESRNLNLKSQNNSFNNNDGVRNFSKDRESVADSKNVSFRVKHEKVLISEDQNILEKLPKLTPMGHQPPHLLSNKEFMLTKSSNSFSQRTKLPSIRNLDNS